MDSRPQGGGAERFTETKRYRAGSCDSDSGGSSEIVARTVAQKMSESLGQSVFVENKPGGAGNIAMQAVARAAPDGYTLILPLTHVPYKGTGPQLQDLLGGRTDASAAGVPALLQP